MPLETKEVAMIGATMPPSPYEPCVAPSITVEFARLAQKTLLRARLRASPSPMRKKLCCAVSLILHSHIW